MPSLAWRIWNSSPKTVFEALQRRLAPSRDSAVRPEWHRIKSGPIAGAELFLAPEAVDTWKLMAEGTVDQFLFDALKGEAILDGAVCWDVGSHFGYHALAFAALAGGKGEVVAFEPNPANQERIRTNLERNPSLAARIRLEPLAVADHTGTMTFVFARHLESGLSSGSHLAAAQTPNSSGDYARFESAEVNTATIDDLVLNRRMKPPTVLKIDVEGAESLVLSGGRMFFQQHRPLLLIEVHHILQMFKVLQFLGEFGYRASILDEANASPGRCFIIAR
jgi:FkbM family methyltransferase